MELTKEQLMAIEVRNCNLLVSAAAGSGKTSVLVERIIRRVLDEKNPVDIDKIVVVTFTKAAAEEMKKRLVEAFEKKLQQCPSDNRLIRQISLTDHARITTIDSLCSYIVRNYYNSIGYDPAFRIADEGETELLKSDVIEEILEERFKKNEQDFIDVVESFAPGKKINNIAEIIISLHDFSESHPWPYEWIDECKALYEINDVKEFNDSPLIKYAVGFLKNLCKKVCESYKILINICNELPEFEPYIESFIYEEQQIKKACNASTFEELSKAFDFDFKRLKPIKSCSDEETKNYIQAVRNNIKTMLKNTSDSFFKKTVEENINDIKKCRNNMRVITSLTLEFAEKYRLAKEERHIVTFSDIEHLALKILVSQKDGKKEFTHIADELSGMYEEIYIDEYQDSNLVQENILVAISRCRFNKPNIFMVGDVKQSIYKFRMARPELFISKYDTYTTEYSDYFKIELHTNFRSTLNIVNTVNDVFFKIMQRSVGGIDYTDESALHYGNNKPDIIDTTTEFVYIPEEDIRESDFDKQDVYAYMAAIKIKEIMAKNSELDYKDFAILLRSDKKSGANYADILNSQGIPAVYSSGTGYFSAYEIRVVMDLLRVLDNPRQEIPLAGVMRSYFSYFTVEELAVIKSGRRKEELYDSLLRYSKEDNVTGRKCKEILEFIEALRNKSEIMTIRELICEIIYTTGYYDFVGMLNGGATRKQNLEMLVIRAKAYEETSYSGLFNFVRYIDRIKKYDIDYAEAVGLMADVNNVKIMSIHHSKGLEFPVVILGDSSKKYNLRDAGGELVIEGDFGVGMDVINIQKRTRNPFIFKEIIKNKIRTDDIGEEIRVLYVAMTRAVQKLVILAAPNKKTVDIIENPGQKNDIGMDFILQNTNYASLIAAGLSQNTECKKVFQRINAGQIVEFAKKAVEKQLSKIAEITDDDCDEEIKKEIAHKLEFLYPYDKNKGLRSKYSVSEIKHMYMDEDEEAGIIEPQKQKPLPAFLSHEKKVDGTYRGTAYHKFFEIFDYSVCADIDSINAFFSECIQKGKIPTEYDELIDRRIFDTFIHTELGIRMKKASDTGNLFREKPFIMEIGADMVDSSFPPDEKVLIQGIVDAFFFEDGKVYVVDYKTDRVEKSKKGEQDLIDRYKKQLELYANTLISVTKKPLGACYIYSTCLGKSIVI